MKRAAARHIQKEGGTTGMARESKISSTQIDETSPKTLTHLFYQSMSKATSCQRQPKQHSWWHKHIYTPRNQTQVT
jgi:hypothetical protein